MGYADVHREKIMASKLPVWGIDVGQSSLKAIKLQAAGDHVEMLAVDVVEHDTIISQAESDAPQMISKAIETFLSRNEIKDSEVVVAVSGQQTLTRFTKMPPVEKKKIPDMVQYEASQQIPFDMDEVVWDYQIFAEDDSPEVEVGIFAIRKELIRNHLTHFMDKGIEPVFVQTSPMASYNAAQFESPAKEGEATILLDMGALATDLIMFEGNRIWSRSVPIGGNRFTEALVSAFKISFRKAERLKRSAASSKYARQVFQAMRPVFADLVSAVQVSIGKYTATHREARVTRVLGMGNAFKLPGLQKFLHQNLQISVEKITGFKKMKVLAGEKSSSYTENVMSFGVAYGLALQGLGLAAVGANLLPLEVRRTLLWRKKRPWFAASAACLALAAGSLWVGNVMAGGQLSTGMGNLKSPNPRPARSIDDAERIMRSGATGSPVQWAAEIAGAAEKLQLEFRNASARGGPDDKVLKEMEKLTKNNIYVPRILDVIHRAFADASREEVREVKNARDYLELAARLPRAERRELWIEGLRIDYSRNPEKRLGETDEKKKGRTKPGWAIKILGRTTEPNPAQLLDEQLISALDRLGKEPGRGIHVTKATLAQVMTVSEKDVDTLLEDSTKKGGAPRGRGRRGRVQAGNDRGSSTSPRGPSRRGGRQPGKTTSRVPSGVAGTGTYTVRDALLEWNKKYKAHDPLTDEKTSTDQRFMIHLVIREGDTPTDLIPEVYKEKEDEGKGAPETDG